MTVPPYWTRRNQQSTTSERQSVILLLHAPVKPQDREVAFIKSKWMNGCLTCSWQNMAFQYDCSECCLNTMGCFCGGIHQRGKVIQEAFTLWALLGKEHIKEGWASIQGKRFAVFIVWTEISLCVSAMVISHRFKWQNTSLKPVRHCLQATLFQSVNACMAFNLISNCQGAKVVKTRLIR